MKAVLLVGGRGTRLRSVLPSTPKPLASLGDKPFLDLLIRQLRHQGICRIVMCIGYLGDQIEKKFSDGNDWNVAISYSREENPLGTAGALKHAESQIGHADQFLVMNGDSFLEFDLSQLIQFHREHSGIATVAVRRVQNAARYGTVQSDYGGRVTRFTEKLGADVPGVINAGVYLFSRAILDFIPEGSSSLEKDVLPQLLDLGVYALEQPGMFIDIGTPEDYSRAQDLADQLNRAAIDQTISHE